MTVPNIVWTEVALVRPGQRQFTTNPPASPIASVADDGGPDVTVTYTDGTCRTYARHQELPILADADDSDAAFLARIAPGKVRDRRPVREES